METPTFRDAIDDLVNLERRQQDARWGQQNHPDGTGGAIAESGAAWGRKACDHAVAEGKVTWKHILREEFLEALAESSPDKLQTELIQVMAVCKAWIECIQRRKYAELESETAELPTSPEHGSSEEKAKKKPRKKNGPK